MNQNIQGEQTHIKTRRNNFTIETKHTECSHDDEDRKFYSRINQGLQCKRKSKIDPNNYFIEAHKIKKENKEYEKIKMKS